jgi:acyl-CoA synthetase (AMP-forming)/AMP-acid ligase II
MIEGNRRGAAPDPALPASLAALLVDRGTGPDRERIALRFIDRTTESIATATYGELLRRAAAVARELAAAGVRPGDRVILLFESRLEFYYGLFGAMLLGAVPAAVYPPLTPGDLPRSIRHLTLVADQLGARAVATSPILYGVAGQVRGAARRRAALVVLDRVGEADPPALVAAPGGTVLLQYTSGSLGVPKAIQLTDASIFANLCAIGDAFAIGDGDVGLSWLPLYHDMGLHSVFFGLIFRMPLIVMSPVEFLHRPSSWLRAIGRYRVTHSPAPTFGFSFATRRIKDVDLQAVDLKSWRVAMCGAEPIDATVLEKFAARFASHGFRREAFMPAYGLAESTVAVSFAAPGGGLRVDRLDAAALAARGDALPAGDGRAAIVSVGRPIGGHQVRIVGEGGAELPDGRQGEIEVRGPSLMTGYLDDEAATRAALDGGWLHTGDLGYARDGELYITGRIKDLIIRGGKNYHPQDIEAAATVEGVRPGAVIAFARKDPQSGTEEAIVVAEAKREADLGSAELRDAIQSAVHEAVGLPLAQVVLVGKGVIPKTTSGKLKRRECKTMFEAGTLAAPEGPSKLLLVKVGLFGKLPVPVQRLWEKIARKG